MFVRLKRAFCAALILGWALPGPIGAAPPMTDAERAERAASNYRDGLAALNQGADGRAMLNLIVACGLGEPKACYETGNLYIDSTGSARDPVKSASFFTRACDGGVREGCFRLAVQFHDGDGMPSDLVQAARHYATACDLNLAQGCSSLGLIYRDNFDTNPDALAKDGVLANELLTKGCNGGDAQGCSMMGVAYIVGKAVTCDYAQALGWYQKAIALGETEEAALENAADLPDLIAAGVDCKAFDGNED